MKWQDTKGMCVSIRFPSGGNYAVGPMEMDEGGRLLFRMMISKRQQQVRLCAHRA